MSNKRTGKSSTTGKAAAKKATPKGDKSAIQKKSTPDRGLVVNQNSPTKTSHIIKKTGNQGNQSGSSKK